MDSREDIPISASQCKRFHLQDDENITEMLQQLEEQGYVVIADVASTEDIEKAKELFWQYLEQPRNFEEDNLKRDDCSTWDNWIGNAATGIIGSPKFNHSEFSWFGRLLPKTKQAFSTIWKTNDLIVSFDAGNAFRPWKINPSWTTLRNWWHVDQNSLKGKERQGRVCIQGLITYYDITEESGGFCVLPRSHQEHDAICARNPSSKLLHDYVYLEMHDPIFSSTSAILPLAKAGDLILWDSRTVHCNTPGFSAPHQDPHHKIPSLPKEIWIQNIPSSTSSSASSPPVELLRLVSYVCMIPRTVASHHTKHDDILFRKKLGWLLEIPTSHWPQERIVFLQQPWEVDEETKQQQQKRLANAPAEMLRLAGFTEQEIVNRQLPEQEGFFSSSLSSWCVIM